jgi:hypothetical protein
MAVTRHMRFEVSAMADSIVVFGRETFVKLSHEHTGVTPAKSGFGGPSAARTAKTVLAMNAVMRVFATKRQSVARWIFMAAPCVSPSRTE